MGSTITFSDGQTDGQTDRLTEANIKNPQGWVQKVEKIAENNQKKCCLVFLFIVFCFAVENLPNVVIV